jgi:hypothetical protein
MLPPSNLTPRIGSTPGITSVSPTSGIGSGSVTTPGWPSTHPRNISAKSPDDDINDKGEDGSEEEEAADLLVYFHARSGGGESTSVDETIEVPGDGPRHKPLSGSSGSSPTAEPVLRKRKRIEKDEEFGQISTGGMGPSGANTNVGGGNTFP